MKTTFDSNVWRKVKIRQNIFLNLLLLLVSIPASLNSFNWEMNKSMLTKAYANLTMVQDKSNLITYEITNSIFSGEVTFFFTKDKLKKIIYEIEFKDYDSITDCPKYFDDTFNPFLKIDSEKTALIVQTYAPDYSDFEKDFEPVFIAKNTLMIRKSIPGSKFRFTLYEFKGDKKIDEVNKKANDTSPQKQSVKKDLLNRVPKARIQTLTEILFKKGMPDTIQRKTITEYDISGKKIKSDVFDSENKHILSHNYLYNAKGLLVEETWYAVVDDVVTDTVFRKFKYYYDFNSYLVKRTIFGGFDNLLQSLVINYNKSGKIMIETYTKGQGEFQMKYLYRYHSNGKILLKLSIDERGKIQAQYEYGYNQLGEVAKIEIYSFISQKKIILIEECYKYDTQGNIIEKTDEDVMGKQLTKYEIKYF